jgi:hypothetical protein
MIEGLATNAEYVIIVALVASITQNVKQTPIPNQWLPFVAMGVGAVAGLAAVYITGGDNYVGGAIQGLVTALGTSGGVDAVKAVAAKVTSKTVDAMATTEGSTTDEAK